MSLKIFSEISFDVDRESFYKNTHLDVYEDLHDHIDTIIDSATQNNSAKGIYLPALVTNKSHNTVEVNKKIIFQSELLANCLQVEDQIFPFIVTCGEDLEKWAQNFSDVIDVFAVNNILEISWKAARDTLQKHIQTEIKQKMVEINPGTSDDWPLSEQGKIMHLLNKGAPEIGISIHDNGLIIPERSLSGIFIPDSDYYKKANIFIHK